MKYLSLVFLVAVFGCTSEAGTAKEAELLRKENELLKRELELERKERGIEKTQSKRTKIESSSKKGPSKIKLKLSPSQLGAKIQLIKDLLNNISEECKIDGFGNLIINMGSASAGRVALDLGKVDIRIEERPEEPGCADICPPRAILKFKCLSNDCISDPAMPELGVSRIGMIVIDDISIGRKVFEELKVLQKEFK